MRADVLRWPHSIAVKLDPLSDLQSNVSSDSCVLSWSISSALAPLASLLSYELAFKRREEAWEVRLVLLPWSLPLSWGRPPRATAHPTQGLLTWNYEKGR